MTVAAASAPAKLILVGEHAAVFGQPALVAALDLRLVARLETTGGGQVRLELPDVARALDVSWPVVRRWTDEARKRWESDPASASSPEPERLAVLALGEAARELAWPGEAGLTLTVRSRIPPGGGLGSSAALSAAVIGGMLALAGETVDPDRVERVAMEVERRQHGRPSGIDAAAVTHGGAQWLRRGAGGALERRPLPPIDQALADLRVYDSGRPVEHTGLVVESVRRRVGEDAACREAIERLGELTGSWAGELGGRDDGTKVGERMREAESLLERLGVVPAAVRRVVRAVESAGGAAKISGAGALSGEGAGCVLVHHPDPGRIASCVPPSWKRLEARLAGAGVREEGCR